RLDEGVRRRIIDEARGNPLALLELPRGVSSASLAGGFAVTDSLPLVSRVEASFRRRVDQLPEETQRLLLLGAAEPTGDPMLLWQAAAVLGLPIEAAAPAEAADLIAVGTRVTFRHPLLRSAIYAAASPDRRRTAHRALAEAIDAERDPDRRAWHRAHAALAPDEEVALELELSADRAGPPPAHEPHPSDLLLDGLAQLVAEGLAAAAPTLRKAVSAFRDDEKVLQFGAMAATAAAALWDLESWDAVINRQLQLARDAGALAQLATALQGKGIAVTWSGDFRGAATVVAEADAVTGATGIR